MKKLEKSLDYYKEETKRLNDEMQAERKNQNSISMQWDTRSQELNSLKQTKTSLEEKCNLMESELSRFKASCEELKSQNLVLKTELNEVHTHTQRYFK